METILLSLLIFLVNYVSGLPLSPAIPISKPHDGPWRDEPRGRGTFGLMRSCVLTLTLCVYTAIHLNVDPSGKIKTLFRRKVLWSFIALFSPEIVVLSAYQQWFQTKELQAKFDKYKQNESMEQQIEEGETFSCMKRHRKDMSVGWFVVMGGTTVNGRRHVLTPLGAEFLMKLGLWKPLDAAVIQDKGKADSIAKFIVCIQAAWMIVQCGLRKVAGLPITLIELNALVHVMCAFLLYFFWWSKPLNVKLPIDISVDATDVHENLEHVLFASEIKRSYGIRLEIAKEKPEDDKIYKPDHSILHGFSHGLYTTLSLGGYSDKSLESGKFTIQEDTHGLLSKSQNFSNENLPKSNPSPNKKYRVIGQPRESWERNPFKDWGIMKAKQRIPEGAYFHFLLPGQKIVEDFGDKCDEKKPIDYAIIKSCEQRRDITVALTEEEIAMLFVAARAVEDPKNPYQSLGKLTGLQEDLPTTPWGDTSLVTDRAKNLSFPTDLARSKISGIRHPFVLLSVLTLLYGGGFSSAWTAHFPSRVEQLMWRYACVASTLPTIICLATFILQKVSGEEYYAYRVERWARYLSYPVLFAFFSGRVFLIVESFISIRDPPPRSYETVKWSEFWPHL